MSLASVEIDPADPDRRPVAKPYAPIAFQHGVYRTSPTAASRWARLAPTWSFHPRFVSIVWRASAQARRHEYGDEDWTRSSFEVMQTLEHVGVQFEITGVDNLHKPTTPCLIVGNHMSTLETGVLPSVIQPIRKVTFVVKKSLIDYPVFKYVMRTREPIAVGQTNVREDFKAMMEQGAERLSRGYSLVIFPEGRRRPMFDPANFNTVAVKLAHRAGVPIVPLAMVTDAWALGKRFADFGRIDPSKKVRFAFGEPMTVSGRGADEQQALIDFIRGNLAAWDAADGLKRLAPVGVTAAG